MTDSNKKMRKICINLVALSRSEYSETIEIPKDTPEYEIHELVEQRWKEVDGSEFSDDMCSWEKGECYWEDFNPNIHMDSDQIFVPTKPEALDFCVAVWKRQDHD